MYSKPNRTMSIKLYIFGISLTIRRIKSRSKYISLENGKIEKYSLKAPSLLLCKVRCS